MSEDLKKQFFIIKTEIVIKFIELDNNCNPIPKTRIWHDERMAKEWVRNELSKRKVYNVSFTKTEKLEVKIIDSNGNIF